MRGWLPPLTGGPGGPPPGKKIKIGLPESAFPSYFHDNFNNLAS